MVTNKYTFKRALVAQFTVEAADISGAYAFDQVWVPVDNTTINSGTETGRVFYGHAFVKTSVGLTKTGFALEYKSTGAHAGYLQLMEGADTFATGDIITVVGTLV